MRLISCYIENFGKLHSIEIPFEPGESVIYEENGWGKSTLAVFIRVMFFGFENDGKHDEILNERKRFTPWQDGVYGGRIVFETEGREYRLERTFDRKRSGSDTAELYDQETNQKYDISEGWVSGGNIGISLFGIDSKSFRRTVFIGQQDCSDADATAAISAKIGRVSDQAADMNNYEKVRAFLEKELNRLSPRRKTGQISKMKMEAAELSGSVREKERCLKKQEQLEAEADRQKRLRQDAQSEQKQISDEIRKYGASQKILSRNQEYSLLLKAEADAREDVRHEQSFFSSQPPSIREIDEWIAKNRRCEKIRSSLESRTEQAELLRLMASSGKGLEDRSYSRAFLIIGVLLLVAGLILVIISRSVPGLLMMGIGIGAAGIGAVQSRGSGRASSDQEVEVDAYRAASARYEKMIREMEVDKKEADDLERQIRNYLSGFGLIGEDPFWSGDPEQKLQLLRSRVLKFQNLWEIYRERIEEREEFEKSHDAAVIKADMEMKSMFEADSGNLPSLSPDYLNQLTMDMNRKQLEIENLTSSIYEIERQLEENAGKLAGIEQAEADLAEKKQQIDLLQHRYNVIDKTGYYLEQARTRFSARYMGTVRKSFEKYYRMITGEDGAEYELDADFSIKIREQGGLRDAGLMSEGRQDLIGLCRRMALIDAMYEKEKPFLVFDDPFVNLDDRRLEGALRFLDHIAEEYQVLYFSCSEARIPAV